MQTYLDSMFGNARDVMRGRQMPDHITSRENHYASVSSPVGTQITHAVGFAWAAKRHLELMGHWDQEQERDFVQELDSAFRQAVASAEAVPAPPLASLFDDVYAELPWHLCEQRGQLLKGARPPRAR